MTGPPIELVPPTDSPSRAPTPDEIGGLSDDAVAAVHGDAVLPERPGLRDGRLHR